jgi:hypothetical protein
MKSQLFEILFLIFAVIFSILSYFLITSYYFKQIEKEEEKRIVEIFDKMRDIINSFLKLSLYYSTVQHFREESHTWIYNSPNPINFEELKNCKEKLINISINKYFLNFEIDLPIKIEKKQFEFCKINVNEIDLKNGYFDEGNFTVNCSNAYINIYTNTTQLFEYLNISNFIINNRYWYLFRNIQDWSKEAGNIFVNCISNLVKNCIGCLRAYECYEKIFEMLKKKFDKYVKCEYSNIPCCFEEKAVCKNQLSYRKPCNIPKDYSCYTLPTYSKVLSYSDFSCEIPLTFRIETSNYFICQDEKYYESYPSGTIPIKFSIGIYADITIDCANCKERLSCSLDYCSNCREICKKENEKEICYNFCEICIYKCPCNKCTMICKNCIDGNCEYCECACCKN